MDPEPPRQRTAPILARRIARLLPVLGPLAILLVTGFAGLDFGQHWDERLRMNAVRRAVANATLLPGTYNYPSLSFWLSVGSLAPEIARDPPTHPNELSELQARLEPFVMSQDFRMRVRGVFLVVSSLIVVWVYLAHLRWRRRVGEALLAATLAGLSFELAYHARWIAPDMVNAQFAALCLMLCIAGWSAPRSRPWFLAAALAAGLAAGTKYTAGLLLLPVLGGLVLAASTRARARRRDPAAAGPPALGAGPDPRLPSALCWAVALFALSFLATTPGALLQPFDFYRDVRFEMWHYAERGHFGYTVEPGLPHMLAQLRYLGGAALSPSPALAWSLAALIPVGAAVLWRESRSLAFLLLAFPLLFLLYLSTQRVFFARNVLLVLPFLALLAARGAAALAALGPAPLARHGPLALALVLIGAHGTWLAHAAGTIRDRHPERAQERFVGELDAWLERLGDEPVYVDPRVQAALARRVTRQRSNVTHDPRAAAHWAVILPPEERVQVERLPSNRPGSIHRVFGPRVVNREYYWTWRDPQILVTTLDYARASGLVPGPE